MPHTVEAVYHDGVVELKEKPPGIKSARVLVTFLDGEEKMEGRSIDWDNIKRKKSAVDKWIGLLKGINIGDWKGERRKHLEEKHR